MHCQLVQTHENAAITIEFIFKTIFISVLKMYRIELLDNIYIRT